MKLRYLGQRIFSPDLWSHVLASSTMWNKGTCTGLRGPHQSITLLTPSKGEPKSGLIYPNVSRLQHSITS